jgi:phosphatidate cytidylyltransferase
MLARLRARGAVPGLRGIRAAGPTVRRPHLTSLTLRVLSGIVAVPLLLTVAYLGDPLYGPFIALATAYAAFEIRSMLRSAEYVPLDWLLVGLSTALPLVQWLHQDTTLLVTCTVVASLAWLLIRPTSERALVDWALSLALALYLGGFMLFYLPLRNEFPSVWPGFWVMWLLILSWVCDSSAFFVGRAFGRTPLAPHVSPKKSVEGAFAGLVAPTVAGFVLGLLLHLNPVLMAGYGLVIALATIVGDLIESLIKRQTGVKDSGVLIPGHGGLLDRMDSLLVCAPVAVLYLRAFLA